MASLVIFAGHWGHVLVVLAVLASARPMQMFSCKQRTFAPALSHQSTQTQASAWGRLSDQALLSRPYSRELRHYSHSDHIQGSYSGRYHCQYCQRRSMDMTGSQSSSPSFSSRAILVSSYAIVSSNRRLARRPRSPHSVVHMAGLHTWISPLALCYDWRSARAGAANVVCRCQPKA